MRRHRYVPRKQAVGAVTLFPSAEAAWFWYITSQKARLDGARFVSDEGPLRPCDPDDIYRFVMRLVRDQTLTLGHVRILLVFGFREIPPEPRDRQEETAARMWDEALDRLSTILISRKIVECPSPVPKT